MAIDTSAMAIGTDVLKGFVEDELARVTDARVTSHIRGLLTEPKPVLRRWIYEKDAQYTCWIVLEHCDSGTGIAYCESGFGPSSPWGLIWLNSDTSMGQDSGWFTTFLQAFFDSAAAADLPIWRVFKIEPSGVRLPITAEGGWDEAWKLLMEKRKEDPTSHYDFGTSIVFDRK